MRQLYYKVVTFWADHGPVTTDAREAWEKFYEVNGATKEWQRFDRWAREARLAIATTRQAAEAAHSEDEWGATPDGGVWKLIRTYNPF